jgi:tetratricopeptide (TPR) repeat protein
MNSLMILLLCVTSSLNQESIIAKGDAFYKTGNYISALTQYNKANKIKKFEVPQVYLFPKLALTYLKLKRIDEAKIYISKAYIVANIQYGLIICREDEGRLEWNNGKPLLGKIPTEVEKEFCGVGYEYLYKGGNIEDRTLSAQYLLEYINASKEFNAARVDILNFK